MNKEKALIRELTRLRKRQNASAIDFRRMRKLRKTRAQYWLLRRKQGAPEVVEKREAAKKESKRESKKSKKEPELEEIVEPELERIDESEIDELYALGEEEEGETEETESSEATEE